MVPRWKMKLESEQFLKRNKGANELMMQFSAGACFRVIVPGKGDVCVSRLRESYMVASYHEAMSPDFTVTFPEDLFNAIFYVDSDNAKEFILQCFSTALKKEHRSSISISIHKGILKLTTKGYFKIVTLGGSQLLFMLKEYGLGSLSSIKKALVKITNK
jgi:hypothetical protein